MAGVGIALWIIVSVLVGLAGWAALRVWAKDTLRALPLAVVAALLGSFAWSEWFGEFSNWGGEVEGLQVAPAILGAVIVTALSVLGRLQALQEPKA